MKSKRIFFFALRHDLIELAKSIESNFDIKYAGAGLFDEKTNCIASLADILNTDNIEHGDWIHNKRYIILPKNKDLIIREVPQQSGGIKYAIDQLKNEESIIISIGGNYHDLAIIASEIGSLHNFAFIKNVIRHVSTFIKNYKNTKGFYISPVALEKAKSGFRLTTDVSSPVEYDLIIKD